MLDNDFKKLIHTADNYKIVSIGNEVAKGYKPDVMLQNGNSYIILECDTNTSRKGFVGSLTKAAKFLTSEKTGIAVFVLKEKQNTSVEQIYNHLIPYFIWLEPLTNLRSVFIISTTNYCYSNSPIKLLDLEFLKLAKQIKRTK